MKKAKKSKLGVYAPRLDVWFGEEKQTLNWVREQLARENLSVSRNALSRWWSRRQETLMRDKMLGQIASGARLCREVESQFKKNAAPELKTLINLHRLLIFRLSTEGNADPALLRQADSMMRTVMEFFTCKTREELERRKIALSDRRVALLERQAGPEVKPGTVTEAAALTPVEKDAEFKRLFESD